MGAAAVIRLLVSSQLLAAVFIQGDRVNIDASVTLQDWRRAAAMVTIMMCPSALCAAMLHVICKLTDRSPNAAVCESAWLVAGHMRGKIRAD